MASLLRSLVISISVGVILYLVYPFLPSGNLRRLSVAVAAAVLFFLMGLLFKKGR
ncbi:hypothetical protein [Telmatospirillum siberiense]|uniref:hypothetical protein n=1 Tax=Telmatospirillum siberiense TaxID=382514 RepID=UPI0013045215|nr:hypothetical protein [Telmatospirillum siberiense]